MQDNDDDGEAAAGGRIAHLMQVMEVVNVLVVVSRWYGGVKLGPDRWGGCYCKCVRWLMCGVGSG